jgi:hypothetical protein
LEELNCDEFAMDHPTKIQLLEMSVIRTTVKELAEDLQEGQRLRWQQVYVMRHLALTLVVLFDNLLPLPEHLVLNQPMGEFQDGVLLPTVHRWIK